MSIDESDDVLIRDSIDRSRGRIFRILFSDDEEYDLDMSGMTWQDAGEPTQAEGTVVTCRKSKREWKPGESMVFNVFDVRKILDTNSNEIVFER